MLKTVLAVIAALSISGASLAVAQSAPPTDAPRSRPSAEDAAALTDARIAALRTGLKLSAEQEKLWPPVESAIRALAKQRAGRLPGLYAGVCRSGELVWGEGIGVAEVGADRAPTADDQFLVASNTKTFTAVMVMQLRDEGRLTLDDSATASHVELRAFGGTNEAAFAVLLAPVR